MRVSEVLWASHRGIYLTGTDVRLRNRKHNSLTSCNRETVEVGNVTSVRQCVDLWHGLRELLRAPRCSVVVKALCYKPEGRGFETRWGEWIFSLYLILAAALGPGLYLASNRNEHQKQKKYHGLWADCLDNVGSLTSHNPIGLHSLLLGIALLYGDGVCFLWGTNWTVSTATSSQYLAVNCEPIV
jgi:hypothetical protein